MKKFEMEPGSSPEEAAANFAKSIFDSWGIGNRDCSNGVLLLLSVDDRQVQKLTWAFLGVSSNA